MNLSSDNLNIQEICQIHLMNGPVICFKYSRSLALAIHILKGRGVPDFFTTCKIISQHLLCCLFNIDDESDFQKLDLKHTEKNMKWLLFHKAVLDSGALLCREYRKHGKWVSKADQGRG